MLLLAFVFVFVVVCFVLGLILYARWNHGKMESLGIKIAGKPALLSGHAWEDFKKCGALVDIERFKKYGSIYGIYFGREPQIYIADAELIRLIMTKDAEYFNDKRRLDFRDPLLNEMPEFLPYDKWKTVRSFLTPVFSSAKLKAMGEPMTISLKTFCKSVKDNVESSPGQRLEKYDLRDGYFAMITELIARCCFSVEIGNAYDQNNAFVNIVRGLVQPEYEGNAQLELLSFSFPILQKFLPGIFNAKKAAAFCQIFQQMMDTRRKKNGDRKKDVVDMCIEQIDKVETPEYKKMGITETTLMAQAVVFFFAGQDQISTVSAAMIYYILNNPEIEEKVYKEIDHFSKKHNGKINYDNVYELTYLLCCIQESLRLVPFFNRSERVCTQDWENKEANLKIPKGMTVIFPIWAANRNPKYFEKAEEYYPERFMPGNKEKMHPYAFTSFGHGPRNCIGQKFSMDILMLLNAFVLKNFKFHLRGLESEPQFIPGGPFVAPHLPFYFDVTVR